jgi:hypothetical protein
MPKLPIWIYFGGPWNGKRWYMYFIAIWNILWSFVKFFGVIWYISPVLVYSDEKNAALGCLAILKRLLVTFLFKLVLHRLCTILETTVRGKSLQEKLCFVSN